MGVPLRLRVRRSHDPIVVLAERIIDFALDGRRLGRDEQIVLSRDVDAHDVVEFLTGYFDADDELDVLLALDLLQRVGALAPIERGNA